MLGGDLLTSTGSAYIGLIPRGDPDPVATMLESLERVSATGAQRCLPGHGPPFDHLPHGLAAAATALRAECDRAAALLGAEPENPYTLLERSEPAPSPLFQRHVELLALGARLAHLAAQGRAECILDKGKILYRDCRHR